MKGIAHLTFILMTKETCPGLEGVFVQEAWRANEEKVMELGEVKQSRSI